MTGQQQRPPPRTPGMAGGVWLSRPVFLSMARSRTVGFRYARDGPGFLLSQGIVLLWAGLTGSPVMAWVFIVTTALSIAHALQPSKEAHSYHLGEGIVGWVIGSQRVGRILSCVLWMAAGLWAEAEGDFGARNYFLVSGAAALFVIGVVRKRDRETDADLRDGMMDAQNRVRRF